MAEEAPPAEPPPNEGEDAAPAQDFSPPCVDLADFVIKTDFFEGSHMLAEGVEKVEGAANYRQVTGFPVFGLAQPNPEGMKAVLDKVKAAGEDKSNKELQSILSWNSIVLSSNDDRIEANLKSKSRIDWIISDDLVQLQEGAGGLHQRPALHPPRHLRPAPQHEPQ